MLPVILLAGLIAYAKREDRRLAQQRAQRPAPPPSVPSPSEAAFLAYEERRRAERRKVRRDIIILGTAVHDRAFQERVREGLMSEHGYLPDEVIIGPGHTRHEWMPRDPEQD